MSMSGNSKIHGLLRVSMKRSQPPWTPPSGTAAPALCLHNSLTRKKDLFVPNEGRKVCWYSCGPTVYDASHMGHARSYITFDILRRVLGGYFNYDVFYVMNITDVDDKIIQRARRNHLFSTYESGLSSADVLMKDVTTAMERFDAKFEKTTDPDKKEMMRKTKADVDKAIESLKEAEGEKTEAATKNLLQKASDPISAWLDSRLGAGVSDHSIFSDLTQRWEREFHRDMAALNVLPADVLTRVSEYVPEIVEYVQKIIDNGYGYVSNGSVYFDCAKFDASPDHSYAKLVPEAVGNLDALAEGEGELSVSDERLKEKRNEKDFALWKASKPGEPEWDSPWGKGRPGWHIECSVMCCDILGSKVDIHTGGVDLKFPHHDNEIAQAEARYGHNQWVSYFLHSGHLTIEGCKMSKSLKNFITIKEALKRYTSRQLRFAFLLHAWNATLDYSANTMQEAEQTEKLFNEFFLTAKDLLRNQGIENEAFAKWGPLEKELNAKFLLKKSSIHVALCDSIDTASALNHMRDLVKEANIYISMCRQSSRDFNLSLIKSVAVYLTNMLKVFGAIPDDCTIGFPLSSAGELSAGVEAVAGPFVGALARFRDDVRVVARKEKVREILDVCDALRDDALPELGVRLEDIEGQPTAIKFVDKEILLAERKRNREEAEAKRKAKEEAKRLQAEKQAAKEQQKQIPPSELFRREAGKFSQFDEQGIPTHDADGTKIGEGRRKKMRKMYQQQEKLYAEYVNAST
ncbi:cysteine--tRNA ligase, cytoplasmic-like [Oscarella lobularis]|uniref:cysteine--tRNA ligase, cytoplasmic-like n=1 Tax=Oscarella lobularis TaxID=121494 RepID=UPI0033134659